MLFIGIILLVILTSRINADLPLDIMSRMDMKVDPCDDFYMYSCGGWLQDTSFKPTDVHLDASYDIIDANNDKILNEIVSQHYPIVDEFWESCINVDKMNGIKALQNDLSRIINAKTSANVLTLAGEFSRTGTHAFTKFNLIPGIKDTTINSLYVTPADLTLDDNLYFKDEFSKIENAYRQYIHEILELSGFSHTKHAVDTIISIEQKLAHIKQHVDDELYHVPIDSILELFPITLNAFSKGLGLMEKTRIDDEFKIYMDNYKYWSTIEKWLALFPIDSIKVYVAYVLVHSRISWIGTHFYQASFKFFGQTLRNQQHPEERTMICKSHLKKYLSDLIGKYYYHTAFDQEREKKALDMIQRIQKAMKKRILTTRWLSTDSQNKAKNKLDKMIPLIGQTSRPKSYPSDLSRDNYYDNVYKILSHTFDHEMKKLGHHVNRKDWYHTSAIDTNAFYTVNTNTLVFPAAILQPPLFYNQSNVHPARNFGAIGTTVGHEIIHGFDRVGYRYDDQGNLDSWWNQEAIHTFDERSMCFINQYSAFQVHGQHDVIGNVRGTLTLNENIADNDGLTLAWDAYREYMTTVQPKTKDVTIDEGDQMFFMVYAQTMCEKTRDDHMRELLVTDSHAPGQWRVNGVVMNNQDFSTVFHCNADAPMNPRTKCSIW